MQEGILYAFVFFGGIQQVSYPYNLEESREEQKSQIGSSHTHSRGLGYIGLGNLFDPLGMRQHVVAAITKWLLGYVRVFIHKMSATNNTGNHKSFIYESP